MGGTAVHFIWLQAVLVLALVDPAVAAIGFIFWWPLWVDCTIALALAIPGILLFRSLLERDTFVRNAYLLAPVLAAPAILPTSKAVRLSLQDGNATIASTMGARVLVRDSPSRKAARLIGAESAPQPIRLSTPLGAVTAANTHAVGKVGERFTTQRLTAEGLEKLNSKIDSIHGIDGLFCRRLDGQIVELIVTETKVNKSQLKAGQLTRSGVEHRLRQAIEKAPTMAARQDLEAALELVAKDSPVVSFQLWRHDLSTGTTRVREVTPRGEVLPPLKEFKHLGMLQQAIDKGKNLSVAQ